MSLIAGTVSVSYTHLDVYKRQAEIRARCRPSTSTLTVPSGSFSICKIDATVPTVKRLSLIHISLPPQQKPPDQHRWWRARSGRPARPGERMRHNAEQQHSSAPVSYTHLIAIRYSRRSLMSDISRTDCLSCLLYTSANFDLCLHSAHALSFIVVLRSEVTPLM